MFEHVRPYHTIRAEFRRYLRVSFITLKEGFEEHVKSTNRLYEQWGFFQLAAAFRKVGLHCVSQEGLFHRSHQFRYTLDIDRGARLTFLTSDRRAIILRFEPWVLPYNTARERRETVYRGRRGRLESRYPYRVPERFRG